MYLAIYACRSDFSDVKAAPDFLNPQNGVLLLSGSFDGVEVPVSIWLGASTNQFVSGKTLEATGQQSGLLVVAGQPGKKEMTALQSPAWLSYFRRATS